MLDKFEPSCSKKGINKIKLGNDLFKNILVEVFGKAKKKTNLTPLPPKWGRVVVLSAVHTSTGTVTWLLNLFMDAER